MKISGLGICVAAVAVAVVCLGGCSGGGADEKSASVGDGVGLAEPTDSNVAPDFSLTALDGEIIRLSDSAGQVRLVDFWATWCAPCREEIPMLNELEEIYGPKGFRVLAIGDENESADLIRDFAAKHDVRYTNLLGSAEVAQQYNVIGLPSAYLLDGKGEIVETFQGAKPRRILEKKIKALLDGSAG